MIKSPPIHLEGYCGESRISSNRWDARRFIGRAIVYLRYDETTEKYPFAIFMDGKQVNVCEIGAAQVDLWNNDLVTPEAFDRLAESACAFTSYELDKDNQQPGMLSGMNGEAFDNALEYNATNGEMVVKR